MLAAGEAGDRTQSKAKLRFNRKSEGRKKIKNESNGWCGEHLKLEKNHFRVEKKSLPAREKMNAILKI